MKNLRIIPLALICIVLLSCSSIFENENSKVTAKLSNQEILIENGQNESIYYIVIDQNILAQWAPYSSPENEIKPNSIKKVSISSIDGFEEGHSVAVFYWKEIQSPFDVKKIEVI